MYKFNMLLQPKLIYTIGHVLVCLPVAKLTLHKELPHGPSETA